MNLQTWESIFSIGGNLVVAASLYITLNEIVKSEKDKQREVANKVFIWWDKKKGKKKKRRKKKKIEFFQISNHSTEPVHDVVISIEREHGDFNTETQNQTRVVGIVPPGDFYVEYEPHIERSMGAKPAPVIYFVDSSDRCWKRESSGKLIELDYNIAIDGEKVCLPQKELVLNKIK